MTTQLAQLYRNCKLLPPVVTLITNHLHQSCLHQWESGKYQLAFELTSRELSHWLCAGSSRYVPCGAGFVCGHGWLVSPPGASVCVSGRCHCSSPGLCCTCNCWGHCPGVAPAADILATCDNKASDFKATMNSEFKATPTSKAICSHKFWLLSDLKSHNIASSVVVATNIEFPVYWCH